MPPVALRTPWLVAWPLMLVVFLTFPLVWLLVMLMRPDTAPMARVVAGALAIGCFVVQLLTARVLA